MAETNPQRPILEKPVAFVFSGGASLAAYQAGMVQAYIEAGIQPDICVGVSAGAINAAFIAQGADDARCRALVDWWLSVRRQDVFPGSLLRQGLNLALGMGALYSSRGLERLLVDIFDTRRLEDSVLPVGVLAARMPSGAPRLLVSGPLLPALLASTAIPGLFPPVEIDGQEYVDGSVVTSVPLQPARLLGAKSFVILDAGPPCADHKTVHGRRTLGQLIAAVVSAGTRQRIAVQLPEIAQISRVIYTAAPCSTVSALDFDHAAELIDLGTHAARQILASGWPAGPGFTGDPHYHDDPHEFVSWGLAPR